MKLIPADCTRARPKSKAYKLNDGAGLYLYVAPGGGKLWRFDYAFQGKRKTLSIGAFPTVSLDDARERRDGAKRNLANDRDPMAEKKVAKLTARVRERDTFAHVAAELIRKLRREGKAPATIKKRLWLLKSLAADLRSRPIAHITAPEILAVLQKAESRGRLESARRLRAAIGQAMRLAVASGRATTDPTPALRGAIATPKVRHRSAVTDLEGVGKLIDAIDGYDGAIMRHALLIAAYCFPRPGELRLARWSEVDLRSKIWVIPASRTKMRREHRIPLSPLAAKQFAALKRITRNNVDGFCFPGLRPGRPISENTLNAALRMLGFDGSAHVAHGFRSTASTILNEHSDFSADAIERALGHQEVNAVRRAYHRAEHWEERVEIMNWYSDFLDKLRRKTKMERLLS
jgi:integrase